MKPKHPSYFIGYFTLSLGAAVASMSTQSARAADATWNSSPTNGIWEAAGAENNWSTGAATFPGATGTLTNADTATFLTSGTTAISINSTAGNASGLNIKSITFGSAVETSPTSFTIGSTVGNSLLLSSGGTISISSSVVAGANATETINAPIVLEPATATTAGAYTFSNGAGSANNKMIFNGTITGGTTTGAGAAGVITLTLTGANSGSNAINGIISNGGANSGLVISKTSSGAWTLNGANTFSGGVTLSGGTLNIGNASALGTGTFNLTTNATTFDNTSGSALTIANNIVTGSNQGYTFTATNDLSVSGTVTINGGTGVQFAVTTAGKKLTFGNTLAFGGFTMEKGGAGTLVLNSAGTGAGKSQSYGGVTTTYTLKLSAGILELGNKDALGTGAIAMNAGTLQTNTSLTAASKVTNNIVLNGGAFGGSSDLELGGVVNGTGALIKNGSAALILSGSANTYAGATTLNSGTLRIGAANTLPVGTTVTIGSTGNSATLDLGNGAGSFNQQIAGLATAGTAANQTITNSDTTGAAHTATLTVNNDAATSNADFTFGGLIQDGASGSKVALAKSGSKTLTLSNANTYTGGTTISAGTLLVGNNAALGTGGVTLAGGTLASSGSPRIIANSISVTTGGNIRATAATNFILNGALSGAGGIDAAGVINSAGLLFGGNNSGYTGTLMVSGANVRLSSTSAGSAGAIYVVNGGLQLDGGAGTYHLGSLSGTGEVGSHNSNVSQTLRVGALDSSTTFSGKITNIISSTNGNADGAVNSTVALTKVGAGTLTLSGANDYTGATAVNAGTLKVTGAIGGSAVTVTGTGSTLASGTTGSIGSSVSVNSGAILAAGNVDTIGTATVGSGGATLNSGSIFSWDLDTAAAQTAGTGYDNVVTTSLGGASAVFAVVLKSGQSFSDPFWSTTRSWDNIFSTTGLAANALGMSSVFSIFTYNGSGSSPVSGSFTFTGTGGNTLQWTAVPEPTSALAGLLVAAGMLRRRRLA